MSRKGNVYTYKEFSGTCREVCDHFGVNYNSVKQRLLNGMNLEVAIETPTMEHNKIYIYKGTSGTIPDICKHFGASCSTVKLRIKTGMSLKEAIEIPLKRKPPLNQILKYNGQNGTIKELCEFNNKDFIGVYDLIKSNHTIEWAMAHGNDVKIYHESSINKELNPLDVIRALVNSDPYIHLIYSNGGCWQFYKILKTIFPKAKPYKVRISKNSEFTHIITKIDNIFYDIDGNAGDIKKYFEIFAIKEDDIPELEKWKFSNDFFLEKRCPSCNSLIGVLEDKTMGIIE